MFSMIDIIKKALFLGIGAASVTREKVEEIVDELIKRGEVAKNERSQVVKDFLNKVEDQEKAVMKKIEQEVEKAVTKLNIATKKDIEKLEKKIATLEKKK